MSETVENPVKETKLSEGKLEKSAESCLPEHGITINGKNSKQIKCQRCPSTILVAGIASLVTHEFKLPEAPVKEGEAKEVDNSAHKYWCVDNMYAFENVGFSKTVDGVKYLICADCEIGPIGWHDLDTKLSYVSLSKVDYC